MKREDFEKRFKKIVMRDGVAIVHVRGFDFMVNNYYVSGSNIWLYCLAGGINLKMKAIKEVY